jgi:hypothetical protein
MSSSSTPTERSASRSNSFDSIPEVDFLQRMVAQELSAIETQMISEFKLKEKNGELLPEPLLTEDKSRFVLFPIQNPDVSAIDFFSF